MDCFKRRGFTLIELLIVIGIISFLLAIIIPALGRAKDQSRVIVCRSNLKGLLIGSLAYSAENNGRFFVDKQLHNSHSLLLKSLSDGGYVENPKAYYCPSEKAEDIKYTQQNFSDGKIGYFYFCFTYRPTYRYLSTFFLKKTPWPRQLKDTNRGNKWVFADSWFSGKTTAHRWYKKGVNYVRLDGSVHMVKSSPKMEYR